ncbi:MAG: hypothetical protein WC863_04440 [Patescibacteria group bacterium]
MEKILIITVGATATDVNPGLTPTGKGQMNSILNSGLLAKVTSDYYIISGSKPHYNEAAKWLGLEINISREEVGIQCGSQYIGQIIEWFMNHYVTQFDKPILIVDPSFIGPKGKPGMVIEIASNGQAITWPLAHYKILFSDNQLTKTE